MVPRHQEEPPTRNHINHQNQQKLQQQKLKRHRVLKGSYNFLEYAAPKQIQWRMYKKSEPLWVHFPGMRNTLTLVFHLVEPLTVIHLSNQNFIHCKL